MIRYVFFDCDSTLVAIEGIDELAKLKGKYDQVGLLTKQAMSGQYDLSEVFAKRLDLIKPSKKDLEAVGNMYIENLTPGAKELVKSLLNSNRNVFIISAGYQISLQILAKYLNIPSKNVFGVSLDFDSKGNYLGFNENQVLTRSTGKKELISQMNINLNQTAMVGDGANDLAVRDIVKLFIGFRGAKKNDFMEKNAKILVNDDNLLPVLTLIKNN